MGTEGRLIYLEVAGRGRAGNQRLPDFPKTLTALKRQLDRIKPDLERDGIVIERSRSKERIYNIFFKSEESKVSEVSEATRIRKGIENKALFLVTSTDGSSDSDEEGSAA
jgi:hypothetical protein